jgi:hypothetical protein
MTPLDTQTSTADWTRRNGAWAVALLAIASSITGVTNGFAFDDVHVIVNNDRVHSLNEAWRFFGQKYWPPHNGDSLYRPLTILAFALQWAIGGGSPLPFHVTSVALYAACAFALYRMLRLLVPTDVALVASALFAVHPVHTEAVANVIGQAELIVALLTFIAVERYVTARRRIGRPRRSDIAVICSLYLASCLFKENAIVMPALLLAAEIMIEPGRLSLRRRVHEVWPLLACMTFVALVFVVVRTTVTGDLRSAGVNEILSGAAYHERALTMLGIVVEWVRLLIWPAALSADYSFPRTQLVTSVNLAVIIGLVIVLSVLALAWHFRRSSPAITFGALWMGITLAIPSNLFLLTGFILAERSLFMPSVGVVVCLAVMLAHLRERMEQSDRRVMPALAGLVAILLVTGVVRSSYRNPVWRNNETLFEQTVRDVPMSSRARWMLSEHYARTGRPGRAAEEITLAVVLGRMNDFVLLTAAADQMQSAGMCSRALPFYERAINITPHNEKLRANAAICLVRLGMVKRANALVQAGLRRNPQSERLERLLAAVDSLETNRPAKF